MTTDFDATARVARGAKLLDLKRPGWAGEIDPDLLDMRSCAECVLGQLHGRRDYSYGTGVVAIGFEIWDDDDIRHGFHAAFGPSNPLGRRAEYAALRVAWLAEVAKRTGGAE